MGGGNSNALPNLSQDFISDPSDPRIKGFDTSQQKQALMRDFARQGGQARSQALAAQTQALGGSRSSGTAGMLADIAAQQGYGQQKALGDLAMQEAGQRMSLMDYWNNVVQAQNAAKSDLFNMRIGQDASRSAQQQQNVANIFKLYGAMGKATAGGM